MWAIYLLVLIASFPVALTQTQCITCPSGWSVDMNGCCIKQQAGATNTSCALSHTGAYEVDGSQVIQTQIEFLNNVVVVNTKINEDLVPDILLRAQQARVGAGAIANFFNNQRDVGHLVLCIGCTQQYCKYCPASA